MEKEYKVGDVMTADVFTVNSNTTIREVAKMMAAKELGSAVVVDNNPSGIITEQDLARKVLAKDVDPDTTPVSAVMSKKLITAWPDMDLNQAIELMGKSTIKHLPVLKDDALVGIVSYKDIIAIQPDLMELASFRSTQTQ